MTSCPILGSLGRFECLAAGPQVRGPTSSDFLIHAHYSDLGSAIMVSAHPFYRERSESSSNGANTVLRVRHRLG